MKINAATTKARIIDNPMTRPAIRMSRAPWRLLFFSSLLSTPASLLCQRRMSITTELSNRPCRPLFFRREAQELAVIGEEIDCALRSLTHVADSLIEIVQ